MERLESFILVTSRLINGLGHLQHRLYGWLGSNRQEFFMVQTTAHYAFLVLLPMASRLLSTKTFSGKVEQDHSVSHQRIARLLFQLPRVKQTICNLLILGLSRW